MNSKAIPYNTIRRLPKYFHYISELIKNGENYVTSDQIAHYFNIHPTQVRKDLQIAGLVGKPKVGHVTVDAIATIEEFLGWNNQTDAFIVGAGNLGSALLGYHGFDKTGVKIVAAFDSNPDIVGTTIKGVKILPIDKFTDLALRMHVKIGILTCSADAAQQVANTMIVSGIKAIWNFTPTKLYVPDDVISEHTELYSSLAVLSRKLSEESQS
ncbi:MAG: redox-sensing transcriptional repressor Rex [Fibrobacterales bacterium]